MLTTIPYQAPPLFVLFYIYYPFLNPIQAENIVSAERPAPHQSAADLLANVRLDGPSSWRCGHDGGVPVLHGKVRTERRFGLPKRRTSTIEIII